VIVEPGPLIDPEHDAIDEPRPLVDCEHHVIVGSFDDVEPYLPDGWRVRMREGEFTIPRPGPHPGTELEARAVAGADAAAAAAALAPDLTHAVLVASQPLASQGWLGHRMSAVFAAAVNDHVIAQWLPADPRFRFAISVSAHDGQMAADEIRRLGSHPAAVAVSFSPIAVNLGQRHYEPIYAAASDHGLAVIVHPGGFEGNVVGPAALGGVGPRTPEEVFCLLPQVAMSSVSSLVFEGVFERHPGLRVVFAGFGFAWAPIVVWRMDSEWRGLRVEVPWLARSPSQVVAEHIRFVVDGAVERDNGGQRLAAMLDPSALIWGSDVPFAGGGTASLAAVPPALRGRIGGANALETFTRLRGHPTTEGQHV
jgi:predicted TIM-barrel fold metal-dependent hydrolase